MRVAEYIDKQVLLAEYDRVHAGPAGGARKLIEEAPAADVAPVVHGRWDGEKDHGDFREVKCTACGGILLVKWSTRLSEYSYCPNCGARMDGTGDV